MSSSPSLFKFDKERCHRELVKIFIIMELLLRLVEHEAFIKFLSILQPKFNVISCATLICDILTLWDMEKIKLKSFISQHCQRVWLTTDTWISNQNLRYMCLIAHFIDNNWKLSNKILNFCQVTGHSRKVMAKFWEGFLNSWGLHDIKSYH